MIPPLPDAPAQVLAVLDGCAEKFTLPCLDNGYLYLAATRLTIYRSATEWAIVMETFGFNVRSPVPVLWISTFASHPAATDRNREFHPNDDVAAFEPIDPIPWEAIYDSTTELIATDAPSITLRGERVAMPTIAAYLDVGIELADPPNVAAFELCRFLAATHRDRVLATPTERRTHVSTEMVELLVLDEWHHPDLVRGERPSESSTFQLLASVIGTGDPAAYRPSLEPNTHWRHWPEGGTL